MPEIIIITGDQGEGKTSFVEETILLLRSANIQCSGILARGTWKNGLRDRFYLEDLKSGKKIVYCQRGSEKGWEKIRHFYINPAGQDFGQQALSPGSVKHGSVVVIDEIGPFELEGKGWARSLEVLLAARISVLLIVIRRSLLEDVLNKWKIKKAEQFDVKDTSPEALYYFLEKILNQSL
jgi:nucleoside-triphosphatase